MAFTTKPYKNRDSVFILDELDDINQQLDDHQIELQTIMASRFVAPVRERVENWLRELRRIADVIEEWVTLQKNWMYLEFIFSSEDIKEQLPTESDQFDAVDRLFRGLTNRANTIGNVYKICTENDVLEELHRSNADIDHIQKKLEDYLETKRVAFPRFYFLSNDELLSILSDVRNPKAVQPHLQKCFDSIAALVFADAACTEIAGMQSPEGEKVDFESPVYPIGNVEQ